MEWYVRFTERLTVRRAEGERYLLRRRSAPVIDPSYGDARLAGIRAAAIESGAEGWPGIRAELAAAAGAEDGAGGDELTFLVAGLQSVAGLERWIGEVVAAEPGDPLALLVAGARQARTQPSGEPRVFRTRLETAEAQLSEVAEREPTWAAPCYFRQLTGRGLQVQPAVAARRFEETCRRSPGHLAAHREQLQQLCRKSGGSHEQMHAFARESMLAAPEGSPLGELVATAYLEEWLDIGGDPESVFMTRPAVLRALHEAATRSVHHPAFARRLDWRRTVNTFAMAFALAADPHSARPLFKTLGKAGATEFPWRYLDARSPLVPFLAWRARVGH